MTIRNCPGCGSSRNDVFYEVGGVPANSRRLLPSRAEAVALPRGDIALAFCRGCGLVFNAAFDPGLVDDADVDDELYAYSGMFRAFQRRLADQVIERYGLRGKEIMEIGCGRGDFLGLLCELGANHGAGIYAGYAPDPEAGIDAGFRREPFTDDMAPGPTDFVCSKRLLEYVADPVHFIQLLRRPLTLRKDTRLFLQVSNFVRTLRDFSFWEIHYARCGYFTSGTLDRLLRAQAFTVSDIWTDFEGQYLMADTRVAGGSASSCQPRAIVETIADLENLVARFAQQCREKQALWCEILHRAAGAANLIAIWGAGPSAASFLTTLAVGDEVSYVIDLNPARQGKYTPGTGHRIVAPDVMLARRPDVVIVMNSAFTFEIQELLAGSGCAPTLLIA